MGVASHLLSLDRWRCSSAVVAYSLAVILTTSGARGETAGYAATRGAGVAYARGAGGG